MEANRLKRSDGKSSGTTTSGKYFMNRVRARGSGDAAQHSDEEFESLGVEDHQMLLEHLHINLPEGALNPEVSQRATHPDVIKDSKEIVRGLRNAELTVVGKPRLSCVNVKHASELRQKGKITDFVRFLFFKKRTKSSEKSLKERWETNSPESGCRFRMRDTFFMEMPVSNPRKSVRSTEVWKALFGNPADNKRNEEDCLRFFLQQKGLEPKDLICQRECRVESGFISGRVDYLVEVRSSAEGSETSPSQNIIIECKGTKGSMVGDLFSLSSDGDSEVEFNTLHQYYHQTQAYLYILRKELNPAPITAVMVVKVTAEDTQPKFYWGEVREDTGHMEELNSFCQEEALPQFLAALNLIFQRTEESDSDRQDGTEESDSDRQDRTEESDSDRQDGTEESDSDRQDGTEESDSDRQDGTEESDSDRQDGTEKSDSDRQDGTEESDSDRQDGTEESDSDRQDGTEESDSDRQDGTEESDSDRQDGTEESDSDRQDGTEESDSDRQDRTEESDSDRQDGTEESDSDRQDKTENSDSVRQDRTEESDSDRQDGTEESDSDRQDRTEESDSDRQDRTEESESNGGERQ